jgi:hypothetical protein
MPTYRIVVRHESLGHHSVTWMDLDDDQAALAAAIGMLAPAQGGWVWEDDRAVGYAVGPQPQPILEDNTGSGRKATMRLLDHLLRRRATQ